MNWIDQLAGKNDSTSIKPVITFRSLTLIVPLADLLGILTIAYFTDGMDRVLHDFGLVLTFLGWSTMFMLIAAYDKELNKVSAIQSTVLSSSSNRWLIMKYFERIKDGRYAALFGFQFLLIIAIGFFISISLSFGQFGIDELPYSGAILPAMKYTSWHHVYFAYSFWAAYAFVLGVTFWLLVSNSIYLNLITRSFSSVHLKTERQETRTTQDDFRQLASEGFRLVNSAERMFAIPTIIAGVIFTAQVIESGHSFATPFLALYSLFAATVLTTFLYAIIPLRNEVHLNSWTLIKSMINIVVLIICPAVIIVGLYWL